MMSTCESPTRSKPVARFTPTFKGRVLIACEDVQVADELVEVLKSTHLRLERAVNFTSACKLLKTGKFQVVFATPRIPGGSWKKLMDFAYSRGQTVSFVVVARSFDLSDWANCLKNGAFEVLDLVRELSRASDVAMQAFSAAWAIAGLESRRPEILELHDFSPFRAKYPEVAT
jgi:DNA-binding NtrC family response regulator